jgi:hypothetical protein
MFKTIALILSINIILSADPISPQDKNPNENNISKDTINAHSINQCHKTFGRYNSLSHKCIKPIDNNLSLSNIYSYVHSL